jgi:hypothetical protein
MATTGTTAYAKQQMLAISVGLQPFPSLYLALFTNSGDPSGSPSELAVANYVRKPVPFFAVSTTVLANSADIVFPALGAGAFLGAQLIDAPAGTTVWTWIDQASSFTIPATTDLTFAAGTLTLTVS